MAGDDVRYLNPETLPKPAGYAHVVDAPARGRLIHVSGQVALDRSGTLIGAGDFREQATRCFENLKAALAAAGADFQHVVKINMFVLDMAHLQTLREVRDRYVDTAKPPASTLVQVSRFFRDDLMFEVDATAVIPG
jgi:enamine deaminase RidA (YjgF/YER057c/UK114 family)